MKDQLTIISDDLNYDIITEEEARTKLLILLGVRDSLPIKRYDIDFGGNVMAGIEIKGQSLKVFGAMNGYGDGIDDERIKITERRQ
ncbi:MAG: hypothetical protein WDA47_00070 [Bacilli bacterium]